jgi:hypothetical protein
LSGDSARAEGIIEQTGGGLLGLVSRQLSGDQIGARAHRLDGQTATGRQRSSAVRLVKPLILGTIRAAANILT